MRTCQYKICLSLCHPEQREGSDYIHFMYSDSSLRSEWHDILIAILHYDTPSVLLIPSENITGIDLFLYVIQATVIAVGNDGIGLCLERCQVIHHATAEKEAAVR